MKIKKISLKNIGPYVNKNELIFNLENLSKHMVLIGGKNGAGKTTLFNAIKICLYGCLAYGYENVNTKYLAEIEKIINTSAKMEKECEAEISMQLLLDDGKDNFDYLIIRSWKVSFKKVSEYFEIYKNGIQLTNNEKDDFLSYIFHLIPPNLFKFYFFDGEKLNDFTFSSNKTSDFKEAFLKLCNLDTMEIIRENFKRISRSKNNESLPWFDEYDSYLKKYELINNEIINAEDEFKSIEKLILSMDDKLAQLEKDYSKNGGITKKEWQQLNNEIIKEENKREENRKWLKDVANNVIPFIILKEQLQNLKVQIELENKTYINDILNKTIDTPLVKDLILNVLRECGVELSQDITFKIVYEILNFYKINNKVEIILNLSEIDKYEVISKINSFLAFDIERIKIATDNIESSLKLVKNIRKKLEQSSIDNYEEYLQKKVELNENKSHFVQRLFEIDKKIQQLKNDKDIIYTKLSKAKQNYELVLKKQSVNDISARALLAFDELQEILYKRNIKIVEEEFRKHFSNLINKQDLLDGIFIDNNLNVYPFKNKLYRAKDIDKIIKNNGEDFIITTLGMHAYEVLKSKLLAGETEFMLPIEVKQQFSAGEKQIFIMALYQALTCLNKINIPFIIDTPFARIDSEHRENILKNFFKKLKGQILILSTDEELVLKYKNIVSDIISDNYMLCHTENGTTKIVRNSYFGESK